MRRALSYTLASLAIAAIMTLAVIDDQRSLIVVCLVSGGLFIAAAIARKPGR